jgi:pimeloyl-ACP methyl ester carboxylesterase
MARLPLAALLLCGCAVLRAPWKPPELPQQAEHLEATTRDGWKISVIHYAGAGRPVLLLHGIVTNERNFDLDEKHSFARWLAAHGRDVYAMSLRGTGESQRPGLTQFDWDFDTYVTQDVPAAVQLVLQRSGAKELDFIGHSLGGMILYAALARGQQGIARAVTIGSPVGFRWGPRFTTWSSAAASTASHLPFISLTAGTLLALPALSWYPTPLALVLYNPQNMDPSVWESFLSVGVDDESPVLAAQAARWMREDRFLSRDGAVDYEQELRFVKTPFLVVAGKVDQLGFPPLVRRGFDALGSSDKTWLLVGEENGASADYGHMDLLLGERAATDVFEPILRWLK